MQDSSFESYKKLLSENGLRNTSLKSAFFKCLYESDTPLTAKQLIRFLCEYDQASVYRSLNQLVRSGILIQVPIGLKYSYELNDTLKPHHHHITCESCGATKAIDNPSIESLLKQTTLESGLTPTRHHFELYGICANCS